MDSTEDNRAPESESIGFGAANTRRGIVLCCYANAALLILMAVYFFLIPFLLMVYYLTDPAIKEGGIPRFAVSVHRSVSPKYEQWACKRIKSEVAKDLSINNISGTEWPVFGSFFYLLGTEAIQEAWDSNNKLSSKPPKDYAAGAIKAAAALIADPGHAAWVKQHWGEDYLHDENVFYRMLQIGGLTSYQKLSNDDKYLSVIEDRSESLSQALDESPHGLLDDYPYQCYPTDVVAAIAVIKRADAVLGADHSDFVKRSIRGFSGKLLDETGLPPFAASSRTGIPGISRGCSSQWGAVWAAELWPEEAKIWYANLEKHFWQERWGAAGFREYRISTPEHDWSIDVDAGPVVGGFGTSASAFGVGAARANGRLDHAYSLTAQIIAVSWPLLDGTLLIPRLLSNATDAPYVGECSLLFALTRRPAPGVKLVKGAKLPRLVYLILAAFFVISVVLTLLALARLKSHRKHILKTSFPGQTIQVMAWSILIPLAFLACLTQHMPIGIILILFAQLLPIKLNRRTSKVR